MARDNLKELIERGGKIPPAKALNSQPKATMKNVKLSKVLKVSEARERTQVHGARTLRGLRK